MFSLLIGLLLICFRLSEALWFGLQPAQQFQHKEALNYPEGEGKLWQKKEDMIKEITMEDLIWRLEKTEAKWNDHSGRPFLKPSWNKRMSNW